MNNADRQTVIVKTSIVGICVNTLMALAKVVVGLAASSIAIVSEGVNNATDALNSVLTFVGIKLSCRHPDRKHPFGYGRIEYLTGLLIAVLIIVGGVELLTSSVKLIFNPPELSISYVSLSVIAVSAVCKFILGVWTAKKGRQVGSSALEGVGADSKNDSFMSIVTIASSIVFLLYGVSVDAYAGIFISALIIKSGVEILLDTVSELIGRPGEKELAVKLYKEILATDGVQNAADMMLHNYGPESYSGSVNIEMDHEMAVGEIYQVIHKLQLRIMHEYKVTMVFGIYAVDNDHDDVRRMRKAISDFVSSHEHIKSFHALYAEPGTDTVYCDFVVDYDLRDWKAADAEFREYMKRIYPDKTLELTIETEFV